jgi:hypothetical protein
MTFCPNCRSEYRERVQACPSCGETLVDVLPPLPKPPGVIIPRIKRFLSRFAGRDTSPPRLQSFLLEQPPDWRHSALALALAIAMSAGGPAAWWLRQGIAPLALTQEMRQSPGGWLAPDWIALEMVLGVLLGTAFIGVVVGLVARKRGWLWAPLGLCVGLLVEVLILTWRYPNGRFPPAPSGPVASAATVWRFQVSASGLLLIAVALACAAGGGILAKAHLRHWSAGIVTLCLARVSMGWALLASLILLNHFVPREAMQKLVWPAMMTGLPFAPELLLGVLIGWMMRRSGLAWGAALGLFALYEVLFGGYSVWHAQPGWLLPVGFYIEYVVYKTLSGAAGGLIGQYLRQWKVNRIDPLDIR